jgi:Tol biopolymer transport system component
LSVTPGGTLAYVTGPFQTPRQLMLIGDGGKVEILPFPIRSYSGASLSPDRSRIIASAYEGGRIGLRLLDLTNRSDERLELPGENWDPVWQPDGRHYWFNSMRAGNFDVYRKDANSSSAEESVLTSNQDEEIINFTPDGASVLYRLSTAEGQYRFHLAQLASPQSLSVVSSDNVDAGSISRDGKYLAYVSEDSPREVYVKELIGNAAPQKIGAGGMVTWSHDGKELLVLREPEIVAIRFSTEGGRFRTLGERSWSRVEGDYSFEFFQATTDGRVFVATAKELTRREIRVVLNWQQEIAARLAR